MNLPHSIWIRMETWAQAAIGAWLQSGVLILIGLVALWALRRRGPGLQTLIGRWVLTGAAAIIIGSPLSHDLPQIWTVSVPSGPSTFVPHAEMKAEMPTQKPAATGLSHTPASAAIEIDPAIDGTPVTLDPKPIFLQTAAVLWAIGSALTLAWILICQLTLLNLRRTSQLLRSGAMWEILGALTSKPPRLYVHRAVASPFLAGALWPSLFLPLDFDENSTAEQRAVFAHELAHRERRDCAWNLGGRLLCAALWTQPLIWILCRQMAQISEDACDLAVLKRNYPAREYADFLLTLAERRQGSLIQRSAGAGVVPFRSAIGRRIQRILSPSSSRALTWRTRLGASIGVLAAVGGSVLLLGAGIDAPHFGWAKQQGWSARPIRIVSLDSSSLLPPLLPNYRISRQDKSLIQQITTISYHPQSEKQKLEKILAENPRYFYAEYLLGCWYRRHGDPHRSAALIAQSLKDAPAVLAGRIEYDDGSPLAGMRIQTSIICFSPRNLEQEDGAELIFPSVVTDSDGCYYLPVLRALYGQSAFAWSPDEAGALTARRFHVSPILTTPGPTTSGTNTNASGTHWVTGFIADSRVGVLPRTLVRPQITLHMPFQPQAPFSDSPVSFQGAHLNFDWKPYPNAAAYQVDLTEHILDISAGGRSKSDTPERMTIPGLTGRTTETHKSIDFTGTSPIFNKRYLYSVSVTAFDAQGEMLSCSDEYSFHPMAALAPQPMTKSSLLKVLGSDFTILSIQKETHGWKVITQASPYSSNVPNTDEVKIFGAYSALWNRLPGYNNRRFEIDYRERW